jgi:hypothetical protein
MNIQYLAVIGIVILACVYVGNIVRQKALASKKGSCAADCGCSGGSKGLTSK